MDGVPRCGRRRRLPPVWTSDRHDRTTGAVAIAHRRRVTAHPNTTITGDDGRAIFTRSFDQATVRAEAAADDWCAPLANRQSRTNHVSYPAIKAKPPPFQLQEPYRTIS